jgi:AcrR family transcriptional regulator
MRATTRDRLIKVAGDLFYVRGFQAVGLDQILARVGITKTAFYKHFESKDDLILAVIEQRDRAEVAASLEYMRAHGGRDPRAQILALFDLLSDWFGQPDFRGCLFMNAATEFPDPADPIHRAAAAHSAHLAAEVLLRVQALGAGEPTLITAQLLLLIAGAIAARHAAGASDAALTARRAAELLLGAAVPAAGVVEMPQPASHSPRLRVSRRRKPA